MCSFTAAFCLLTTWSCAAQVAKPEATVGRLDRTDPQRVVLKADAKLFVGWVDIDAATGADFYEVVKEHGDWLGLKPIGPGACGWAKRSSVLPLAEAVAYLSALIEKSPGDGGLIGRRAAVRAELRDFEAAINDYTEAMRLDTGNTWYYLIGRGNAWAAKGDDEKALADFEQATEAKRLLNQGNADHATEAIIASNRGTVFEEQGDYDRAVEEYTKALMLNPRDAVSYFNRGNAWSGKKDWEKAIQDYTAAIRITQRDPEFFVNRGRAYEAANNAKKAIADFTVAIKLAPNVAWHFQLRGSARLRSGDAAAAIADFDEAIRLEPKSAHNHFNRGYAWVQQSDDAKAIADYDEAIRLDASRSIFYSFRAVAWSRKREHEKAIGDFERALAIDPSDTYALSERGRTWFEKGEPEKALEDFNQAIRLEPETAAYFVDRANVLDSTGRPEEAITDLNKAIALDPENAWSWKRRGDIKQDKRELEAARADYDRALELDPECSGALTGRGNCWELENEFEKALADYSAASKVDPEEIDALRRQAWIRATCQDPKFRDGKVAMALGKKACELTQWKSRISLGILAAACAEAGDFDAAVAWQLKAAALANTDEDREVDESFLQLYREGLPYRIQSKGN
jgi:tetratricopeptide (TPR) repeat protein